MSKGLELGRPSKFALFLLAVLFVSPVRAQQPEAPLRVCWTLGPPYYTRDAQGGYSGFFIAFTQLVADEIGVALEIVPQDSFDACVEAQRTGAVDIVAGAGAFDVFRENNVFSNALGHADHRVFVTSKRKHTIDPLTASGLKVVVWRVDISPAIEAFAARNTLVPITAPGDAMFALLAGDVDAILFPEDAVQVWSHRAGVDNRIVPVGPSMAAFDRVVVLNRSRANLLQPIERAIRMMKSDGTISELQRRFGISQYVPPPPVLTVAKPVVGPGEDRVPYYELDETGNLGGFAIEAFRDLAALAQLEYQFRDVSFPEMLEGPRSDSFDIVPLLATSPDRPQSMDYSIPIENFTVSAFVRSEDVPNYPTIAMLHGRRIGAVGGTFAARQLAIDGSFQIATFKTTDDLIDALLDAEIDAAIGAAPLPRAIARRSGLQRRIQQMPGAFFTAERAVALRLGLGEARERLNAVIPGYLLSDDFAALRRKYFEPPVFWTETRQRAAFALSLAIVTGLLAITSALVLSLRARRAAVFARQQAESRTAETLDLKTRLEAVLNAAQSGIVAFDRAGSVVIANARARTMLGLGDTPPPFEWPPSVSFLDPETREPQFAAASPLDRTLAGESLTGELSLLAKAGEGTPRHVQLASSVLSSGTSPVIGSVLILHDVTEQEKDRARANRTDRLSAIGHLTGGIAHDFNNILAVILGNLELLKLEPNDPDREEMLDAGIAASLRGADLTRSMLAFARQARLQPSVIDVNDVARQSNNWMRRALPASVEVKLSLRCGLWPIEADATSLESAFLNLILNARDAMKGQGTLTVATENVQLDVSNIDSRGEELRPGRYVMLAVSDTGSGIDRETLQRMFDPFYTTKPAASGSGMGLAMVLGFVKQSGGTVQVYTEDSVGTTFKLYFPAIGQRTAQNAPVDCPAQKPLAVGGRILLVEDEAAVRKMLVTTLEAAGYDVVAAPNGDKAHVIYRDDAGFDLLVTDIVMPGQLQGTHLARKLREINADLPVIFLSGYASETTVHGDGLRAEDLRLMKPVPQAVLLEAVSRILSAIRPIPKR